MIHIIGGAGFVGERLGSLLSSKQISFRSYDKSLNGEHYVDVTKPESLSSLPRADVVINLAAEHRDDVRPSSLYELVNVVGAANVCAYCRRANIRTIVFTSSAAVYGLSPENCDEDSPMVPFNEYGRSKMRAEAIYNEWVQEDHQNRSLIIVRPTVIFGEGNRGNVYNLLNQIARRRFLMIGKGANKKSMAYVDNVAEFLLYCINLNRGKHVFNYVDKPDLDMNSLVRLVRTILFNKNNIGLRLPSWAGSIIGYAADLLGAVSGKPLPISSVRIQKFLATTAFSSSIAKSDFEPSITLEAALERTIRHEFL